ncbi:indolepyruvate ferredoxin oxidoreductase beta subunit [Micromonospora rhizosphaerae]|uniref:Indolepyruvate ferredoxin oxidoreductase beta subunit n=1 Tax=Micromonospora rhizosphaerae TaxID=568872 RepID=A0A1C6T4X8_9ACTN|nr:indolepyruvate oxidoreductase subunit beta family protein [Micromonospora rhizosphaerae]SCL36455.1 indolepyruvate ferredoxin oxidoreductase beta subunit [Micromonospora rhizosphaerae]
MSSWVDGQRPITIAILAMGGEGGGVLADWIVAMGERAGYTAQNTSVAGVAQRTGATVYYVEMFPPPRGNPAAGGRLEPVLSVFPTPGEVDIVIASELLEAGRAIQRGFCTPDRTVLIASTNRVYAISERIALGDGRVDSNELLEAAHRGSKKFIGTDFMQLAEQSRSVISASLFGGLAGSNVLPFSREEFEAAVCDSGKAVDTSLAAFALGYQAAQQPPPQPTPRPVAPKREPVPVAIGRRPSGDGAAVAAAEEEQRRAVATTDPGHLVGPGLQNQAKRVGTEFPEAARSMLLRGCARTAVYQDPSYTDRYLDRVARLAALEPDPSGEARLTTEAARHVALWMCYQDTIHVALQKIRRARLAGVRAEAHAAPGQLMQVREYLHPQIDEITDTLPTRLGRWLAGSAFSRKLVARLTRHGMVVNTTSIIGFTMLWVMARMRPLRPRSLRFGREQQAIDAWLDLAVATAADDYALACEIVECQQVLKGYGQTHQHGTESFTKLIEAAATLAALPDAAPALARLRSAALADEDGKALQAGLAAIQNQPTTRSA